MAGNLEIRINPGENKGSFDTKLAYHFEDGKVQDLFGFNMPLSGPCAIPALVARFYQVLVESGYSCSDFRIVGSAKINPLAYDSIKTGILHELKGLGAIQ